MTMVRGQPVQARATKAGAFRAAQRPNGTDGASTQQLTAPQSRVALTETIQTLTEALSLPQEVQREQLRKETETSQSSHFEDRFQDVPDDLHTSMHTVVLAGGPGKSPLAVNRAIPALSFGGNNRLVDIALGNSIRSGIGKIHVLTQFNSHHLTSYLMRTYPRLFLASGPGSSFVDVIACTQTIDNKEWSKGSADALVRALPTLCNAVSGLQGPRDLLVVPGNVICDVDFARVAGAHRESGADITVITQSATGRKAGQMGTCVVNSETGKIEAWAERPDEEKLETLHGGSSYARNGAPFEVSLGMYIFNKRALDELVREHDGAPLEVIGRDLIPAAIKRGMHVQAWHHNGPVQIIDRVSKYLDANLALASLDHGPVDCALLNFAPNRSGQALPPSRLNNVVLDRALIAEGCVASSASLSRCVLGSNSYIGEGSDLRDCVVNGNSTFYSRHIRDGVLSEEGSAPGIGRRCVLRRVIVDHDACIGDDVHLLNWAGVTEADHSDKGVVISDGVIIVLSGAVVPNGFSI